MGHVTIPEAITMVQKKEVHLKLWGTVGHSYRSEDGTVPETELKMLTEDAHCKRLVSLWVHDRCSYDNSLVSHRAF